MLRLPPNAEEVRHALRELGAPATGPMQILHAYRLRNAHLHDAFNARHAAGLPPSAGGPSTGDGSRVAFGHRLLAMQLPRAAVEHTLVHGLNAQPPPGKERDWQVNPRSVPEAGCVDMKTLGSIIEVSRPVPPPFALFAGHAAWDALLHGQVEEAVKTRGNDMARRKAERARMGREGRRKASGEVAAPPSAVDTATPAAEGGDGDAPVSGGSDSPEPPKLLLLCRVLVPAPTGPSRAPLPGTATAEPEHILPMYLLHYGIITAPIPSGAVLTPAAALPPRAEKVPQPLTEPQLVTEPDAPPDEPSEPLVSTDPLAAPRAHM